MNHSLTRRRFDVLLAEDNLGDVHLVREALRDRTAINLHVARDGAEALAFLCREGGYADAPHPDLIVLDLDLPRRRGCEVLMQIKRDPGLKRIPVVILTASQAEDDIISCYDLHANCYVVKPEDPERLIAVVKSIETFWLTIAKLPTDCA